MTINRTTLLDLPLPVTGTEPNTWGDVVNYGLTEYLDIAIAGSLALSTDADVLLASTEGTASADNIGGTTAQYAVLRCTGARTVTRNITAPAWAISSGTLTDYSKTYIVVNETTGGQNIVLRATNSATPTYTTGVTIVPGERAVCVWNGSDFVKAGGVIGGSNTQVQYNNGGVLGGIANATSDGTTLSLTSPKVITGINDTNGNELLKVTATASAVNELTLANAATGNAPTLSATGDDTNIGINITPKGSGAVTISNLAVTTIDATNIEVTNIKAKDGTASITLADSTGVASFTANPVLSGGTANGVLYLNGSKVATSGSALTFDGTNFSLGGTSDPFGRGYGRMFGFTSSGSAGLEINAATGNSAVLDMGVNGTRSLSFTTDGTTPYINVIGALPLGFAINGSERMRLDSSGNLGLGVAPSTGSTGRAIELLAPGMGLFNSASNIIFLTSNAYNNSGFKYGATGEASYYAQWLGAHIWSTAPFGVAGNAITFSQVMTLDASGNLGIGTSSPAQKLDVQGSSSPTIRVRNTSAVVSNFSQLLLETANTFSGVGNAYLRAISMNAGNSSTALAFGVNADGGGSPYEAMRLDQSGNLGLGVTPSAWSGMTPAVEIGGYGSAVASWGSNRNLYLLSNAYYGSGGFTYKTTGGAAYYNVSGETNSHKWFTAPSGTAGNAITFTQAMTLFASGGLAIGATGDPGAGSLVLDGGTGAGRITLGAVSAGNTIFSTTTGFGAYRALNFQTASSVTMTLDSSGNLGLGVTPSGWITYPALQISNASLWGAANNAYLGANYYFGSGSTRRYISNGYASEYSQVSGVHSWYTAPSGTAGNTISFTQAMTLDASGNLSVKTTTARANITTDVDLVTQNGLGILATSTTYGQGYQYIRLLNSAASYAGSISHTASTGIGLYSAGDLLLGANSTERARITSGGDLLVGTTDVTPYNNNSNTSADNGVVISNTGQVWAAAYNNDCGNFNRTGSDGVSLYFNRSGSTVGSISVTTTATAFNTTSDYRLKDNQQPLTGSGEFIDALKPKTWDWKSGGKGVGFIAHEVQEVSPGSVVGTKDAVDADGKPVMQAMEYGSAEFIANIIAELQSLRQRVALLEGN